MKAALISEFKDVTEKTGDNISFIGIEVMTDSKFNITLSQQGYVNKLLEEYGVTESADYPDDTGTSGDTGEVVKNTYLKLLMKIMYVAIRTRPDILYTCVVLASIKEPTNRDYKKLIKVMEYLKGTADGHMVFKSEGELTVNCYVDASFNCHEDARGHMGFIIYPDLVGSSGVLIKSVKQKHVADSSAEAELMALHECVKHLIYIVSIYDELGFHQEGVQVRQDNKAVIQLSSSEPVNFKGRSKFINRKYFSVHEYVSSGEIELVYVGTDYNVSDFLTKALRGEKFRRFRIDIMGSIKKIERAFPHNDVDNDVNMV